MGWRHNLARSFALAGALAALWLAGCRSTPPVATPTALPSATPRPSTTTTPTVTPTPSPTPEPLAARVNGEPIRLADYEADLARCRAAAPSQAPTPASCPTQALQALIDRALILQASEEAGLTLSEAQIEDEVGATMQAAGGEAAFESWLAANGWTTMTLRAHLGAELLAQALAEQIAGPAAATAEQAHARHILVATEAEASALLARLGDGEDFETLAGAHSLDVTTRARGGDLGWFARAQLVAPEVEEAAFALEPGATGEIVQSSLGYHVVQTLERDAGRPLSAEQQAALQRRALERWLVERRGEAQIERLIELDERGS
jgi:hypothetical protein